MNLPPVVLFSLILLIGFLTGSTAYYYNKSQSTTPSNKLGSATFQGDVPVAQPTESSKKVDELTKPAEPKGRLSYPANVYTVGAKETLFGIGSKFDIDWQLIKLANGVTNENLIQAGYPLVIPKVEPTTDLYRLAFVINQDVASELNRDLRDVKDDPSYNPIEVTKKSAVPYFGISLQDEFTLLEQNESNGTALVQVKNESSTNVVGLFQPKTKGKNGFWAVLYVEHRH